MSSATPSPSPEVRWHIPGPSSRYHKRAYSSRTPKSGRLTPINTPEPEPYRVQFTTSPKQASRYSSPFTTDDPAHFLARRHTAPNMHEDPHTPIGSPHHAAMTANRGSPFSDYFTDDGNSVAQKASHAMQSPEVQRVLLRLNNLGAHVLRQHLSNDTFDTIESQLDGLESAVGWTDKTNSRHSLHDSGFVDDFADIDQATSQKSPSPVKKSPSSINSQEITPKAAHTKSDTSSSPHRENLLVNAQKILDRVSKANSELRRRFDEVTDMNDQAAIQLEEANRKALSLQSENESLKANLAFDHTELLFLKLQLKTLEVQLDELTSQGRVSEAMREEKLQLEKDTEQWKHLWDDVDTRFRNRREHHRVVSSSEPVGPERRREDGRPTDDEGPWKLDMSRKRVGRVQSVTVSRTLSTEGPAETEATSAAETAIQTPEEPETERAKRPGLAEQLSTMSIVTVLSEAGSINLSALADVPSIDLLGKEKAALAKKAQPAVHFSEVNIIHEPEAEVLDGEGEVAEEGLEERVEEQAYEEPVEDLAAGRYLSAWQELMQSLTDFAGMNIYD